ncbi:MAG: NAD(P)-dependent oxidoreductase [Myxococcota bacterium]
MSDRKTVLVTGAAGTVGGYATALAEAAGYRVIASDRRAKGLREPVRGALRVGDIRDRDFAERAMEGVDHVLHTAAVVDADARAEELSTINTEGVAVLYEAARKVGVDRFLHVSTAMLYDPEFAGALTEGAPAAPRGAHAMSKHAAETYLRGQESGPVWTIVRPAPLYGRRGRHFAAALLSIGPLLRLSTPVLPRPSGGPRGTMVHAEDVARALLFLLDRREAERETFNVSDGDVLALGDRIGQTLDAYSLRSFSAGPLWGPSLRLIGRFFDRPTTHGAADAAALNAWRMVVLRHGLKPALRPRLTREALSLLYSDLEVDSGRLRGLGWTPRFGRFMDGWRAVLRWYQAERWVPRYD